MSPDEIGEGWDAEKVQAHLANLQADIDREEAIYDAMTNAADGHLRVVYERESQIKHCRERFGKPRGTPAIGLTT